MRARKSPGVARAEKALGPLRGWCVIALALLTASMARTATAAPASGLCSVPGNYLSSGEIINLFFDDSGRYLLMQQNPGQVKIYNLRQGRKLKGLFGIADSDSGNFFRISPDGTQLIAGNFGGFCLWDVRTQKLLRREEVAVDKHLLLGAEPAPRGGFHVYGSLNISYPVIWEASSSQFSLKRTGTLVTPGGKGGIVHVVADRSLAWAMAIHGSGWVTTESLGGRGTRRVAKLPGNPYNPHRSLAVAYDSHSARAYVLQFDGALSTLDRRKGVILRTERIAVADKYFYRAALSPSGDYAVLTTDTDVLIYSVKARRTLWRMTVGKYQVWSVAISADAKLFAIGDRHGVTTIRKVSDGSLVHTVHW